MAGSTITRTHWTNDTGTPSVPVGDGTLINEAQLQAIYSAIDQMFAGAGSYATFTLAGLLKLEGFGTHEFAAGGTGSNIVRVRHTTAGTTNAAVFQLGNDSVTTAGHIRVTSTTFTAANINPQDGMVIEAARVGGLSIAASNASGGLRLFTGGTVERARFQASGAFNCNNTTEDLGAGSGYFEKSDAFDGTLTHVLTVSRINGTTTPASPARFAGIAFRDSPTQTYVGAIAGFRRLPNTDFSGGVSFWTKSGAVGTAATSVTGLNEIGRIGYCNPFLTAGMQLWQGGFDDEIMELQSSDVAHAFTTDTNAIAFGIFKKAAPASGGVLMGGYTSADQAVQVVGNYTTPDTTRGLTSKSPVVLIGAKLSGNTAAAMGANENLVTFRDNTNTRFIFDSDGDSHEDGTGWTAYDDHDDVAVIEAVEFQLTADQGNPIDRHFSRWMEDARPMLERLKLVTFNEDGHHFVNRSRMQSLLCGAVRQLARQNQLLDARLTAVESAR